MQDWKFSLPSLPDGATSPEFKAVYDHWCRSAPPGLLPGRQHIDPVIHIPKLAANLAIFEAVMTGEGQRFRIRLMGELMAGLIGSNPVGRFLDETIRPEFRDRLNGALSQVVTDRIAHFWEHQMWSYQNDFLRMQRLALPLASDGRNVNMILACYARSNESAPDERRPRFFY